MKTIIKSILEQTSLSEQEAWWMLESITNKTRSILLCSSNSSLSSKEQITIEDWILKLSKKSIPLSYLLGTVPFLDLIIKVKPPILIPRQETEEWVNFLIKELLPYDKNIKNILDIGTGSGCIALMLAYKFTKAKVTAIDINLQALKLAKENATLNNITNIEFIQSDLFEFITLNQKFDLIVSNPPYIDPACKDTMMPQVIKWEDKKALFCKQQGLYLINKIFTKAKTFINYNKQMPYQLVIEHDNGQEEKIKEISKQNYFSCIEKKDSFGNIRTCWCKLIK